MAHMPKPYNHKHPSKIEPTTKGTHPISYDLALFAFPFLSFCKESSYFFKLLFFNLLSNPCFLSPCWFICKPLGFNRFCQMLLLQSIWLLFSFLHPRNVINSHVKHVQGQRCVGNFHHLNKKHWNHIGWQGNDFPPTISSICLSCSSFLLSIRTLRANSFLCSFSTMTSSLENGWFYLEGLSCVGGWLMLIARGFN